MVTYYCCKLQACHLFESEQGLPTTLPLNVHSNMEARSARRPQAASRLIGLDDYLKRQSWVLARQLGECSF